MEAKKVITMNVGKTMSKMSRSGMKYACALWVSTVGLTTTAAYAVSDLPGGPAVRQYNLHPAVTKVAEDQGWLHWYMLAICLVIFVGVFGVMFYSILKHRKSVGHKPANFHESTAVEIAWTVVPFLIVIAMALPATKAVVSEKDTTNADLTIKATGMQWKWGYDYITGEGQGLAVLSTLDNSQRILSNAGGPKAGDAADDYLLRWLYR
jgi:cytochrome c oxidase subunit 2